ncbi:Crp/Fnr family transcriptional regulator [Salinarimonas soli]|uniref:Crp/Fnr family transcriptional regulator n=1 Tax=Salinarimonas soli TaxID=1638099 RepID=A0A5B2VB28_9HYPH|nr:Crp/Fnr family transcriptional regulator [Salinarimonas soli]KAA2235938.1 Crp/Fnr family transcriptional regulator [Salinarimonas soli]
MPDRLIQKLALRDRLSIEERRVLSGIVARTVVVPKGEDLVREGATPTESKILQSGFAARYKLLQNGKRQITALHVIGDFVDLQSLVIKPMDHAILALTDCTVGAVPHEILRGITERYPHLTRMLMLNIALDGAIHRQWLVMTGRPSAGSRFAHLVCELFVRLQAVGQTQDNSFHLPVTQGELSDVLGLSTVHVNRTLQILRANELLVWRNGEVEILDWQRLCEVAEFDPTYLNLHNEPR